ncbi:MAG: sirohydrochlorin cobaltochelatase [Chloroflexota bacterium]
MTAIKPVIVIAAYGTGDKAAQQSLEAIDTLVCNRFPGYEVYWAFTGRVILQRVRAAGQMTLFARKLPIRSLEELYAHLNMEGKTKAAVQCLLVHEGSESDMVLKTPAPGIRIEYGTPLLSDPANIEPTLKAMAAQFGGPTTANILVGHGSDHEARANAPFLKMEDLAKKYYRNVFMGTIHGLPGTSSFTDFKKADFKDVLFIPLMITTSEHILNDVMGEKPDSWKNQLGLPARVGASFAETPAVMDVFLKSLERVISRFQ